MLNRIRSADPPEYTELQHRVAQLISEIEAEIGGMPYILILASRCKGANGRVTDATFAWIRNNDGIVRLVTGILTAP